MHTQVASYVPGEIVFVHLGSKCKRVYNNNINEGTYILTHVVVEGVTQSSSLSLLNHPPPHTHTISLL